MNSYITDINNKIFMLVNVIIGDVGSDTVHFGEMYVNNDTV